MERADHMRYLKGAFRRLQVADKVFSGENVLELRFLTP
jgi:hypothetical protein